MDLVVRPCTSAEEVADALVIGHYFGLARDAERAERFVRVLPPERMHGAWDDGEAVGGAGAFPFELSVPGGRRVRAAGVTVVGVSPTHRRRGVLTALMRAQLDDVRARGEPVAYLWASEGTIYGRFGYGLASLQGSVRLPRERTAFAAPAEPYGRLRLVARDDALAAFPPVYERMLADRPGLAARSETWWAERVLEEPAGEAGPPANRLLEVDGRPEGYAVYRVHQSFEGAVSAGHVEVVEACSPTAEGTRAIWRYLLDLDWTSEIRADKLPVDHPLLLLLAEPRRAVFTLGDALWLRLVDVGEALSARGYAADGELVLEVHDPFCPWNDGCWRLADGRAERADAEPELELDVDALGSVYLGGFSFRQLADALRVRELVPGAVERADALFRTDRAPWSPEIF